MDRFRICVCYLITTFLISAFVYTLIYSNVQNIRKLDRLREDVDEIAHLVLHTPLNSKTEPKHITELIDDSIKKRLAGIWDDLYSIKKQLKGGVCASIAGTSKPPRTEGAVIKIDERVNYAAEELGAKIDNVKADPICPPNIFKYLLGMEFSTNPPISMLKINMEPGSCFGYKSQEAEVVIKLSNYVFIDQIAIQHISKKQSPTEDTSSAPKDFQVIGLSDDKRDYPLGKFKFDNNPNKPVQIFNIRTNDRFKYLRFHFNSNHGNPNYTCIYRIAVYGKL